MTKERTQPRQLLTRRQFIQRMTAVGAGVAATGFSSGAFVEARADRGNLHSRGRGFVRTEGTRFVHEGKPFYIAGTNNHYLGWGSHAEVDDVLTTARRMNFNVVRTIMHSVIGSLDGTTKPTIWNWRSTADSSNMGMHGVYILYWDTERDTWAWNDSTVNGLGRWDYVIYRAAQLGLKLDIALLDFWQWAGGVQQINSWLVPGYDPSNDPQRYTFFYSDPRTKAFYKDWVHHVLNRRNTITGIMYKDDPTIFAWDLMNEPEIDNTTLDSDGIPLAQSWISEMSAYIRSIDRHHLVASGGEGFYDRASVIDPGVELSIPSIDFGVWHTYPDYHGITPEQVIDLIHRHGRTAVEAGKPVLLQEFAYSYLHSDQPEVYKSWVDAIYHDPNSAGWTFWRLVGRETLAPTQDFPEAENEPLTGYAPDNGEHFDIINYPGASPHTIYESATVFASAAAEMVARNKPPKRHHT